MGTYTITKRYSALPIHHVARCDLCRIFSVHTLLTRSGPSFACLHVHKTFARLLWNFHPSRFSILKLWINFIALYNFLYDGKITTTYEYFSSALLKHYSKHCIRLICKRKALPGFILCIFSSLTCLKKPVFSKGDLLLWKVLARLYWDLLTSGKYQPACHYF